jgi:hypothetical protein
MAPAKWTDEFSRLSMMFFIELLKKWLFFYALAYNLQRVA